MADSAPLRVTVVYSPAPREAREWQLAIPAGSTVLQALQASGLGQLLPAARWLEGGLGVWGRKCGVGERLRDRDRVEVYRPLQVDPKVARRERFRRQGTRAAGLFARKQPAAPSD